MPIPLGPYVTTELRSEAKRVGRARHQRALERNRVQPYGDPGDDKRDRIDCYGALAEALVAEWIDLPWNKELVEDLSDKPPDVGTKIDVKWTEYADGHLILHPDDRRDRVFVLTRKELPNLEVIGWTTGGFAQRKKFQGHPKARNKSDYWVPANVLMLPELLLDMRRNLV